MSRLLLPIAIHIPTDEIFLVVWISCGLSNLDRVMMGRRALDVDAEVNLDSGGRIEVYLILTMTPPC